MKNIIIKRKGVTHVAIVDDCSAHIVLKHKWCLQTSGYAVARTNKNETIYMHRLVFEGCKNQIDHINGNKLDNRLENLRDCSCSQNQMNASAHKDSLYSKFKGVSFYKNKKQNQKPWRASIQANKKVFHLGTFKTEVEAAKAYNVAAKKLHGEFAKLNHIDSGL